MPAYAGDSLNNQTVKKQANLRKSLLTYCRQHPNACNKPEVDSLFRTGPLPVL
ncbi:MAG: hypothetical protein OXC07_01890 [Kistimonas sp.]|nr:hypothetical protein [Kistimonas sp.]